MVASVGGAFSMNETCPACGGRQLVYDEPCPTCHGSGRGLSARSIQARIPAGVKDGQKIRLRGKGAAGENGGPAGDLFVTVKVSPHRIFSRKGDNLTLDVPVSFDEAALGAEIKVPTLAGSPVTLKIPAGTPNGRTFRVRGKGARKADGTMGDLLATVEVQVPAVLDAAAREAVEAYRAATAGKPLRANLFEAVVMPGGARDFRAPGPDTAVYVISVAAELTGLHPQTLRTYERLGLVTPGRTGGGGRRYSHRDIERLREIAELTSAGIGLEGVRRILDLQNRVAALAQRNEELVAELEATRRGAAPGRHPASYRRARATGCRSCGSPRWAARSSSGDATPVADLTPATRRAAQPMALAHVAETVGHLRGVRLGHRAAAVVLVRGGRPAAGRAVQRGQVAEADEHVGVRLPGAAEPVGPVLVGEPGQLHRPDTLHLAGALPDLLVGQVLGLGDLAGAREDRRVVAEDVAAAAGLLLQERAPDVERDVRGAGGAPGDPRHVAAGPLGRVHPLLGGASGADS